MAKFSSKNQPEGRKKRGKSERTKILDAMKRAGSSEEAFYDLLVKRALNPDDAFGMGELLKRIAPMPKATMPLVEFEFDEKAKPIDQAAQIMKASAEGLIPPDVANIFVSSVASMLKIEEITELQKRIESIEEQLGLG
jgi:hypothetical protein